MQSLEFRVFENLQKTGFTREDAEAFIEYIKSASKEELSTKKDTESIERSLDKVNSRIDKIESKIENIEVKIDASADRVTAKLIQWMAAFMIGQIVTIFSIMKMFDKI